MKKSIVIPYYKKERFIFSTINSIINQTYKNFEIILIDDELTKSEKTIRNKSLDQRIFVYKNKISTGAGEARNFAIQFVKSTIFLFMMDDFGEKDKIEKQINFMNDLDIDFSWSYKVIDELDNIISFRKAKSHISYNELIKSCDIGLSTVMIKKNIFKNNDLRFANLKTKEDYVLWLRLAKNKISMHGMSENLVNWSKTKNSLSSSTYQKIIDGYKVYRIYLKFSRIKSLISLFVLSFNYILKNWDDILFISVFFVTNYFSIK